MRKVELLPTRDCEAGYTALLKVLYSWQALGLAG